MYRYTIILYRVSFVDAASRPDRSWDYQKDIFPQNDPLRVDFAFSIWGPCMPANEFLRVSMLFPSGLDVSVLVFDT